MTPDTPDPQRSLARLTLTYTLGVTLLDKLARAGLATGWQVWATLPLGLGEDLLLSLALGLLAYAAGGVSARWLRVSLVACLLAPIGVLHAVDVTAHRLTGGSLTWQELKGEAGANLGDVGLIAPLERWTGIGLIVAAVAWLGWLLWRHGRGKAPAATPRALRRTAVMLAAVAVILIAVRELGPGHAFGMQEQALLTFVESLWAGEASDAPDGGRPLTPAQWEALLRPAKKPPEPLTAPPKPAHVPKNVVVFLAEGVPYRHTSFSQRHEPEPTPRLRRRVAGDGILFDRYYATWHASNQAIFSVVCSALPPMEGDIVRVKPRIDCGELSEVLHAAGLRVGLFHGGSFSFYNKLALLGDRAYEIMRDADDLLREGRWQEVPWGIDDGAVTEAALRWVDGLPRGTPFGLLLIPITAHYPFAVPDRVKDRPYSGDGRLPQFLTAVRFQDRVFDELLNAFEKRGLYDETLFVWLGDHGAQVDEPPRVTGGRRTFYDASLHTPLVLINRRMFPASLSKYDRVSDRPGSHIDLLPTLLDALGKPPDPRHQGQSLLSDAYRPRRSVFGAKSGRYIGFVEYDEKFALKLGSNRAEYYDLTQDPEEHHDLSRRFPGRMAKHSADARRLASGIRARLRAAPVLVEQPPVADLAGTFAQDARMYLRQAGRQVDCKPAKGGMERTCGDHGRLLWVEERSLRGADRRCVMLAVPKGYMAFVEVRDGVLLPQLTGTTPVMSGQAPPTAGFRVRARVDGKLYPWEKVKPDRSRYVRHARPSQMLRYAIGRQGSGDPGTLCLDLRGRGAR